jgi:hypothetical protein
MITIYVDMDGVLCDFAKAYKTLFNEDKENFDRDLFNKFISMDGFKNLDLMPNARKLINHLEDMNNIWGITVEILSSVGRADNIKSACHQKLMWLRNQDIYWDANFVEHKGLKKRFATPNSILIDDTRQNIYDFNEMHGVGIYYNDENVDDVISKINQKWFDMGNDRIQYNLVTMEGNKYV